MNFIRPVRRDFLLASPYGGAFDGAMNAFFECIQRIPRQKDEDSDVTSEFNKIFRSNLKDHLNRNDNPHLFEGLFESLLAEPSALPYRPVLLLKRLLRRSELIEQRLGVNRKKLAEARRKLKIAEGPIEVLFSPFYFLRQYLTDPEFTASDGYAHSLIRAEIFAQAISFAEQYPDPRETKEERNHHPYDRIRWYIRYDRLVASLQKIERHWLDRDNVAPVDATDFIVMHILASRGYLVLRLGETRLEDGLFRLSRKEFISDRLLTPPKGKIYEFRVLPEVQRLPDASEIVNEIDGLPIPVPGTDVVLFRGLRFAEDNGIVTRLSGRTGTGKTSVALGLAVALAPLGTRTVYLSCEEQPSDLGHRIQTLVPQNIRRLDVFHRLEDDWFSAEHVGGDSEEKYQKIQKFLDHLISKYGKGADRKTKTPPGTIPLFVVIDGIHELLSQDEASREQAIFHDQTRRLVEECRATGAYVLILSAKVEQSIPDELDYLVDFVAGVDFASDDKGQDQPVRVINIYKTRRQASRVGTHVLHISGRRGLRIVPHVSAQLEQRRDFKWVRPRVDFIFDFMLRPRVVGGRKPRQIMPAIQIYDRSQVLVTGVGSAGKSAFGLKLLSSPVIARSDVQKRATRSARGKATDQTTLFAEHVDADSSDDDTAGIVEDIDVGANWYDSVIPNRRKLLILSFLYPEDFYIETWKRIRPYRRHDALHTRFPRVTFEVYSFSPGFLRPEDFLMIVGNLLDRQELEGWPFDGVLIDGLHNVYLQFPYLEQNEMVWPMLFQMLRTRGLTVVTTHTYFTIDPGLEAPRLDTDDTESARRRAAPLLHALVQATDFRVRVGPEKWERAQRLEARFPDNKFDTRIDVLGAIGQPVGRFPLYWDSDLGLVTDLPPTEKQRLFNEAKKAFIERRAFGSWPTE